MHDASINMKKGVADRKGLATLFFVTPPHNATPFRSTDFKDYKDFKDKQHMKSPESPESP